MTVGAAESKVIGAPVKGVRSRALISLLRNPDITNPRTETAPVDVEFAAVRIQDGPSLSRNQTGTMIVETGGETQRWTIDSVSSARSMISGSKMPTLYRVSRRAGQ